MGAIRVAERELPTPDPGAHLYQSSSSMQTILT